MKVKSNMASDKQVLKECYQQTCITRKVKKLFKLKETLSNKNSVLHKKQVKIENHDKYNRFVLVLYILKKLFDINNNNILWGVNILKKN